MSTPWLTDIVATDPYPTEILRGDEHGSKQVTVSRLELVTQDQCAPRLGEYVDESIALQLELTEAWNRGARPAVAGITWKLDAAQARKKQLGDLSIETAYLACEFAAGGTLICADARRAG